MPDRTVQITLTITEFEAERILQTHGFAWRDDDTNPVPIYRQPLSVREAHRKLREAVREAVEHGVER